MMQEWVVGVLVLGALLYVLWRYLPQALRKRLGRVHPKLAQEAGGCGSCGGCGGCTQPPAQEKNTTVSVLPPQ